MAAVAAPATTAAGWLGADTDRSARRRANPAASVGGGLLAGLLSVVGGVTLAIVMGHPIYLIFSAVGFVAAVVSALGRRVGDRRRRRRSAAESERDRQRFAADVAAQHAAPRWLTSGQRRRRSPRSCRSSLTSPTSCGRGVPTTPTPSPSSLGWGAMAWSAVVDRPAGELSTGGRGDRRTASIARRRPGDDEPRARADARPRRRTQPVRRPLARSSNSPLLTGPADWRLVVVADDPAQWEWAAWLPHASSSHGSDVGPLIAAAEDGGAGRRPRRPR